MEEQTKKSEFGGDGRQRLTPDAAERRRMFRDIDEGVEAPTEGRLGGGPNGQ